MNILIVEDQKNKQANIKKVICETGKHDISIAKDYFSARNAVLTSKKTYDFIILDMFLPDAKDDDTLNCLAGKDLIFDLMREEIEIPFIVITQYTEYTNSTEKKSSINLTNPKLMENLNYGYYLDDIKKEFDCTNYYGLHEYLSAEVPTYLGIIFYSNQFNQWEADLKYFISKILNIDNN